MNQQARVKLEKGYQVSGKIRDFSISFDEPPDKGGEDQAPTPTETVCAALAACTTITLKMYANRKEWLLDDIDVEVILNDDNEFQRTVMVKGNLDEKQRQRLLAVANACPVHKLLEGAQQVKTTLA